MSLVCGKVKSVSENCHNSSTIQDIVFILINAPGALQIMSPENDILETKSGQIYKTF